MLSEVLESLKAWEGRKIAVAMSGGVDSSLAAVLLHRAGAGVIGLNMCLWRQGDLGEKGGQPASGPPPDSPDARAVADRFGFPFYSFDFRAGFRKAVIEPFITEYLAGRTPNPCVHCNKHFKLGALFDQARAFGAEAIATGHYCRLAFNQATGRAELRCAADSAKDQTYYLSGLTQPQLRRLVAPLGELTKPQTRRLARELGLHLHDKPGSVDICFVPDNDYRRFLREETQIDETVLAGSIVDVHGRVLGRHGGIHNYTIGQRKGLGLSAPRPLYVVDLLPGTKTVVVGFEGDILAGAMDIANINWVGLAPQSVPFRARVKLRYRSPGELATFVPDPADPARARICFDRPARAITPGQAAVAYDEETGHSVLVGGWITRRITDNANPLPPGESSA